MNGHEASKEVIKFMDDALCNFIKYLMKEFPISDIMKIIWEDFYELNIMKNILLKKLFKIYI